MERNLSDFQIVGAFRHGPLWRRGLGPQPYARESSQVNLEETWLLQGPTLPHPLSSALNHDQTQDLVL